MANKTCSNCGSPLDDKTRFCTVCGTPVITETLAPERFCVQCGNLLRPNIKFCEICGREVPVKKESPTKVEAPVNPTMDELIIPEIDENTFASNKELNAEKFDGFEAAVAPDSAPAQPAAPAPAPKFTMDTAAVSEQPRKVAAVVKPKVAAVSPQQQNTAYQQPMQQPAFNPGAPIPTVGADGKPKKESNVVPFILAALIVIVLIIDAVLFLGKKDDDKKSSKDITLISVSQSLETEADGGYIF